MTVEERVQVMRDAGLTPLADYPGNNSPWLCRCDTCGRDVTPFYSSVARGRGGCSPCRFDRAKGYKGESHPLFKGDAVGYDAAHRRVQKRFGVASKHLCVDCGNQARDWTYIGGCPDERHRDNGAPYSLDPQRYAPRCRTCHLNFDWRAGMRRVS